MRVTGLRVLLLGVAGVTCVALPAAPAGADTVYSGACTLVVQATFSTTVTTVPGALSIGVTGSGLCVGTGGIAQLRLRGTVATTPLTGGFSCAGGLATGTGAVEIDFPGFVGPDVLLVVAEANGAVALTAIATSHVLRFDGAAVLVEDPLDAAPCLTAGVVATTWTGVMGFQDPEPPTVG